MTAVEAEVTQLTAPRPPRAFAALLALLLIPALGLAPATANDFAIIDGRPATESYPAMTALVDSSAPSTFEGQFCGGTLVHAEWVLTAAHCVEGTAASEVRLVIGRSRLDGTGGEEIAAAALLPHPDYDAFDTVNDVALIRLAQPSTMPPQRVAAPAELGLYPDGVTARALGWGARNPNGSNFPDQLHEVDLPIVGDASCDDDVQPYFPVEYVCAGDPGTQGDPGPDTCGGDSGGPLLVRDDDGWVQIGVTSFGVNDCGVSTPGVYAEVAAMHDFFSEHVDLGDDVDDPDGPDTPDGPDDPDDLDDPDDPDVLLPRIDTGPTTDQVGLAVAVSRAVFGDRSSPFGVVASRANHADALGGSGLAAGIAPLLFSDRDALPSTVLDELLRTVGVGGRVFLLGGQLALGPQVEATLVQAGFEVIRLEGADRTETAAAVAQEVNDFFGATPVIFVANGERWPDAVMAGGPAATFAFPVLLVRQGDLPTATAAALSAQDPGALQEIIVVGGPAVVSDAVLAQIQAVTGIVPQRLGGEERTGTGAEVARWLLAQEVPPPVGLVVNVRRDDAFTHALAATMVAGAQVGFLVGVEGPEGTIVTPGATGSICSERLDLLVVGGADVVSADAAAQLADASAQPCG